MSLDAELLAALRQSHGYWLDSIGARIATLERIAAASGRGNEPEFLEELAGARQARADAERTCLDIQTFYAERIT